MNTVSRNPGTTPDHKRKGRTLRWLPGTLVTVAAIVGLGVHTVRADTKQQLIATVDLNRIYSTDWTTFKVQSDEIHAKQDQYRSIIQEFVQDGADAAVPPVDAATLAAWLQLKEKVILTPDPAHREDDLKQLATYEQQGKAASDRMHALENKGNLADDEKKQLTNLQNLQDGVKDTIQKKAAEYNQVLQTTFKTTQDKMDADVQTAITKVGTDNNVQYVFNSAIVGQTPQKILLYSSDHDVDVTDKVLKQLNKTK